MHYSLRRAATWNMFGYAYLILASFISTRLLTQGLGIDRFSTYVLIVATITLISSLDLGLPSAIIRRLAQTIDDKEVQKKVWSTSQLIFQFVSLIGMLLAYGGLHYLLRIDSYLALLTSLWSFFTSLLGLYSSFPQAYGRFGWYNLRTFIVGTGNTLVVGYAAHFGWSLESLVLINIFFTLITILLMTYLVNTTLGVVSLNFDKKEGRGLISFGLKNQLGKLVGQAQSQYGKYLSIYISSMAVSALSISRGLVMNLAGGITQLATAFYPAASNAGNGKEVEKVYRHIQLSIFALSILGIPLFHLFGSQFITWWLKDIELSTQVISLLNYYVWLFPLMAITPLASMVMDGTGHPGVTSLFGVIAYLIELVAVYYILPISGVFAFPLGSIISYLLLAPLFLIITSRVLSGRFPFHLLHKER